MTEKSLRSTAFRSGRRLSKKAKREQESRVGELFAKGYEQLTGISFKGSDPGPDPPDWLFYYGDLTIGVEMFELEQFYHARGLFNNCTNEVYSEFERLRASEPYVGVVISLGVLADINIADTIEARWREKGLKRNPILTFAKELVNLVVTNVPSQDSIPEGDRGLVIPVDPGRYPAVSALAKYVHVARCPSNDPRRTDGKASPLVILCPGYNYRDDEIEERIEEKILSKMKARPNWKKRVDYSVLVAHDLPRGEVYQAFGMKWYEWLLQAASNANVLQAFDEFWLVTMQDLKGKAQRICGRGLSQLSRQA